MSALLRNDLGSGEGAQAQSEIQTSANDTVPAVAGQLLDFPDQETQWSVIVGWRCVHRRTTKRGREVEVELSRVYQAREAAEQFARLARASGFDARVAEKCGVDDARFW